MRDGVGVPAAEPGWAFGTSSINGVQSNFHWFASEARLQKSVQLLLGSLGQVAPGALSHRVRRVPCGETMWRDERAAEKAGEASQLW